MKAKVESETSEKKMTDADLAKAKSDRADAKADLAKATKLREKENADYMAENADAEANLAATSQAIDALEKGMGASFLQSEMGNRLQRIASRITDGIDADDKETLAMFLSTSSEGDYHAQSGQIVGILKDMKDNMIKSIGESKEAEDAAAKSFAELKAAKKKEIAATGAAVESLIKRSGELAVSIVQNKNTQKDAEEEAGDAAMFLANLKKTCADKEAEWEERQKIRADEIAAIGEAIAILNEDDALDLFKKTLKSPPAVAPRQAFLQTRVSKSTNVIIKVKNILSSRKFTSQPLSLLSANIMNMVKSQKVDFSKVVKMIDDMVGLLKQEQTDDESHRDFCNNEFDHSSDKEKDLKSALAGLRSSISAMKDEIQSLSDAVAASKSKIAETDKAVAEATAQRKSENAEYTKAVQANSIAIELIGKAKNRLNKFYNPGLYKEAPKREMTDEDRATLAAGGTVDLTIAEPVRTGPYVFAQIREHRQSRSTQPGPQPEIFEGKYQSKGQKSGGVLALMDKLVKELETDLQAAEHDEKTAQKEYEELMADSQKSNEEETKSIAHKSQSKADLETNLEEAQAGHALKSEAMADLTACAGVARQLRFHNE